MRPGWIGGPNERFVQGAGGQKTEKAEVMNQAVLPAGRRGPGDESFAHTNEGIPGKDTSWLARHNRVLSIAAACVAPILYLLYVNHYAVNDIQFDDWSTIAYINAALHGHLSLSNMWGQHNDSRVFSAKVFFVLFGLVDGFDTRSVILFNALVFIAAYAVLLLLFRHYLGRPLSPIPVATIGLVWFSLADVQNSLWAFQLSWYLTVFFVVAVLFALIVPKRRRKLWFTVAVVAALVASLSAVQGLPVWPLGAICIFWCQPWERRTYAEIAFWTGATFVTIVVYFSGYSYSEGCTLGGTTCTPVNPLAHPLAMLRFFLVIMGNVIPGGFWSALASPVHNFARFEVVGVALLASAVFIAVQSLRYRTSRERFPLPLLLIGFSLSFDAILTLGRSSEGLSGALFDNRYVMPNLILLAGIIIYAWTHMPPLRLPAASDLPHVRLTWLTLFALTIFLVVQAWVATGFGLANGRQNRGFLNNQARLVVNLDRVPAQDRSCELNDVLSLGLGSGWRQGATPLVQAADDHLGEFQPNSFSYYRRLGPPPLIPSCTNAPTAAAPGSKSALARKGAL
jgi:hypothetical protein